MTKAWNRSSPSSNLSVSCQPSPRTCSRPQLQGLRTSNLAYSLRRNGKCRGAGVYSCRTSRGLRRSRVEGKPSRRLHSPSDCARTTSAVSASLRQTKRPHSSSQREMAIPQTSPRCVMGKRSAISGDHLPRCPAPPSARLQFLPFSSRWSRRAQPKSTIRTDGLPPAGASTQMRLSGFTSLCTTPAVSRSDRPRSVPCATQPRFSISAKKPGMEHAMARQFCPWTKLSTV
mmetsp:Transcript_32216/g.92713  ORF Transcript_32216/g.92713 Transcript_32216/m.92713 type:complete len:230 (-) Transcript_32216:1313-2002(-)